ncbi:MAG TPA: Rne/Rng family ribonuclease, partial [Hyphomicrobiaceae bacterium]|nr:Rne/Rng family ribonuclease [Hyphomicrobiaceae bacterium]
VNEAGAVGGHPEPTEASQAMVDKAGTEDTGNARDEDDASDAELDRDSPEPHGLVEDQGVHEISTSSDMERPNGNAEEPVDQVGSEDAMEELPSRPRRRPRSYKIQEVIKRRQVVLIQVVKEERGNKGAALTTYLSLAGRYTVLMPNTARGGGISRKITQPQDRKRLKAIAAELDVPEGMGLIIRTAGAARTKQEIKRDFEYLLRLWESVRELTLQSTAPSLVYEEGNLIKRSIRDLYNKDVEELIVAGDDAHRDAKDFMRMLMPSHAKNVIHYKQPDPLFTRFQIERQLNAMFSPYVTLKSGGYLVINQTEALVAIDVNSGKATREFSIEETALVTNCEAAEEIARQLKLRDLAGLIVIDFIDMEEKRNNRTVERRLKEALKHDRARIQVGRISHFGLLEMSRQRLRTGVLEGSTSQCPHCQGTGIIRSVESVALAVLRGLEDAVMAGSRTSLTAVTTPTVALYILNKKRAFINDMEARHGLPITVEGSDKIQGANFAIEKGAAPAHHHRRPEKAAVNMNWGFENEDDEIGDEAEEINAKAEARDERPSRSERSDRGEGESRRRSRRRGRRSEREDRDERRLPANDDYSDQDEDRAETAQGGEDGADDKGAEEARTNRQPSEASENGESSEGQRRRRRRGRRGGRRNRERLEQSTQADNTTSSDDEGRDDVTQSGNETAAGDLANHETSPVHGEGAAIQPATSLTAMTQPVAPAAGGETEPQPDHTVKTDNVATDGAGTDRGETEGEVTGGGKANLAVTVLDPGGQEATTAPLNTESGATEAASLATSEPAVVNDTPTLSDPPVETRQDHTTPPDAPPRTPRGELAATAPKIERVVVSPGTGASSDENAPDTPEAPVRKGWWQRRFGN